MAVGAWTFVNGFRDRMISRYMDGGTALTYKCALFLSTSNIGVASTTYAALTNEHANANGYTTGGVPVDFNLAGTTDVDVTFITNPSFAAVGGNIVFRYAVIYEIGLNVVCYCLADTTPADVTVVNGSGLIIDSDGSPNPVFDLT